MGLLGEVEAVLLQFREVFRRRATFDWFVLIAWAFLVRLEAPGATSVIRCLGLASTEYPNLLHFFHSTAFSVTALCAKWGEVVREHTRGASVEARPLYVVDGIKVGKAGQKMPGVKLLHQESNDNTKPEYIMGHFWGALSALVLASDHVYSVPLRFQIQDGIKRSPSEKATLVDKMHMLITSTLHGSGIVLADAYYSSKGFLKAVMAAQLHYIGRVRTNTVAREAAPPLSGPRQRGRPRRYGDTVKLNELFKQPELFTLASVRLYGDLRNVRYLSRDLYWQGLWVRFVLSIYPDGRHAILLCTDPGVSPEGILYAYGLRFKIEVSFKALVQTLCGFCYHFWMKAMPKTRSRSKNQYLHRASPQYRRQIARKIEAYERFVNISAIALGILQILAIRFQELVWQRFPLWLRTLPKHGCPSENVVRLTLQQELHRFSLESSNGLLLTKILAQRDRAPTEAAHPMKLAA